MTLPLFTTPTPPPIPAALPADCRVRARIGRCDLAPFLPNRAKWVTVELHVDGVPTPFMADTRVAFTDAGEMDPKPSAWECM